MNSASDRAEILLFIALAKGSGVSERSTCAFLDITPRTIQNWRKLGLKDRRKGSERHIPDKLTEAEEQAFYDVANTPRFQGKTPEQIYAILAQEGIYYGSVSTLYRILRKRKALEHYIEPNCQDSFSRSLREPLPSCLFYAANGSGFSTTND